MSYPEMPSSDRLLRPSARSFFFLVLLAAAMVGAYVLLRPAAPRQPDAGGFARAGGGPQAGRDGAAPQGAAGGRFGVSVLVAEVERKSVPVRFDGFGTVQPMAQVTLRSRIDSQIETVHVADGARVEAGTLLFSLDNRQIAAQIRQIEGTMARNTATLEGAERDAARIATLVAHDASSRKLLDDARTKAAELTGQAKADAATLDSLKVQLGFTEIRAPISGRFGMAGLKAGAVVRQGEATSTLGTIVQIAPIYVGFALPQRLLGDLRVAMTGGKPSVSVSGNGLAKPSEGHVAFIDNVVDQSTGMVMVRAVLPNSDENLWPGALVNVRLVIRAESQLVIPAQAVQSGQNGAFLFVIKDGKALARPIEVVRTQDGEALIARGVEAGETVAIDGQLNLTDGATVTIRKPQAAPAKTGA